MDTSLFIAAAPVFVIASLAMPAGIGGGLLYVPVMLLVGIVNTPNEAAALSQPIVVGAALAANIFNYIWEYRHPQQPLVEPKLALSAICPCLAGAVVGSLLNQMLPQAVIIVLLVIVIIWNLQNSLRKGTTMWKKETLAQQTVASVPTPNTLGVISDTTSSLQVATAQATDEVSTVAPSDADDEPHSPYSNGSMNIYADIADTSEGLRQRRLPDLTPEPTVASMETGTVSVVPCAQQSVHGAGQTVAQPAVPAPSDKATWWKLFGVWMLLIVAVILRGGKGTSSVVGVEMCSWQYWLATGIIVVSLLLVGLYFRRTEVSFVLSFLVGVLSAIVGIGGGLILNPMLLATGLDAARTTATVAVMILMTCSSATTTLFLAGAVPLWPMAVLSVASFLGSLSGKTIIGWIVSKTGRTSILVFLLAAFMLASGSVVILQGGLRIISEIADGQNPFASFTDPCL